jgi:hypothetical protein
VVGGGGGICRAFADDFLLYQVPQALPLRIKNDRPQTVIFF